MPKKEGSGVVFDIQRWSLHDGPGIRSNIFLKGCPLRCTWCSNPESQEASPEIAFFPCKCINCRLCEADCPYGAVIFNLEHTLDFLVCKANCTGTAGSIFACTHRCYATAMKQIGKSYTVDEVMAEVLRDRGIYEKHGGGLTYTGGEPFAQPDFLLALLERTKAEGIRAAVETCAYTDWDYIETALEFLDFVLIDIKLLDEQEHIRHTGVSNTSILENCKKLSSSCAQRGIPLVVRTPVIPGVNDTVDATSAIAGFIHAYMPQTKYYQLLPYHRLGRGKYENLGRVYALNELEPPSEAYIQELNNIIHDYGLQTSYE